MTRSGWVVIVALACLLGVGSFALVRMLAPNEAGASGDSVEHGAPKAAAQAPSVDIERAREAPEKSAARVVPKAEAVATELVDDSELADAHWIEGRVVFPNETPVDEELWVVAQGRKFENRPLHRMKVGADGRFRVAFAAKTKKGTLGLDAHYLYLKEPVTVTIGTSSPEFVLQPLVGGRIRGACRVPVGRDDLSERARAAAVYAMGRAGQDRGPPLQRTTKLDEALAFDLGGLDPAIEYHVSVTPKEMVALSKSDLRVASGKVLELEFELREGARISGLVVDDAGAPVGNATLGFQQGSHSSWGAHTTQKDGTFTITGIEPGPLLLKANRSGFVGADEDLGKLVEGDVRTGLRIVLGRGFTIRGRVQWPGGKPAAGAMVNAAPEERRRASFSSEGGFKAGEDGAFEVTGLEQGTYKLIASARRSDESAEPAPAAESAGETKAVEAKSAKKRARGPTWRVEVAGVATGTSNTVLVLESGATLAGVVVDETGAPVEAFTIVAQPANDGQNWEKQWQLRQSRSFKSPEGRFELVGLVEGAWDVRVDAKGLRSESMRIDVPVTGPQPTLVVPRAGELRGLVRDAAGKPAPGARVRRVETEPRHALHFQDVESDREGTDWAVAGADGQFVFDRTPIGTARLVASAAGAAASLPVEVQVIFGEAIFVELALRSGGTIRGVVLGSDGRPDAGRPVHVECDADDVEGLNVTADTAGRFLFEHVTAGTWRVEPRPTDAEMREERGTSLWETLSARSKRVTIVDGQTVEVQLGGIDKDAITVRGRVTLGGKALAAAHVRAWSIDRVEGEELRHVSARTDDGGTYELALPRHGAWQFSVQAESGASLSQRVDVPTGSAFRYDADFPQGTLRGRVVDRDGRGLESLRVSAGTEDGAARDGGATSSANASSGEDGRFRIEGLAPGNYRLSVQSGWAPGGTQQHGAISRSGCSVPEQGQSEEFVLVVDRAGTLDASVIGLDGKPLAGARIVAQPVDAPADRRPGHGATESDGRATIGGLAPGAYLVHASSSDAVLHEPKRIVVVSSERAKVELVLVRGGAIVITAEDADGKRVGAWCTVVDERGIDYARIVGGSYEEGTTGDARPVRYSPLPPGRYAVGSKNRDGVEASAEAVVTSGGTARVALRYGGPR